MNILTFYFLDMDAGASEVNTANRLEFLIKGAKESMARKNATTVLN
jgi:hypothetical protein